MDVKKAIRKVVAIGTGATMVGATLFGAMATADLANYPAPFVQNGQFNAVMVIGKESQAIDNMAMTNIATGLQVAGTAKVEGTSTATGDSLLLDGGGAAIYLGDTDLKQILDDGDLSILADGSFVENDGDYDNDVDYSQFLTIDPDTTLPADGLEAPAFQANTEDDNNKAGMYMKIENSNSVYQYDLNFKKAVKIDDGVVNDGPKVDMATSEIVMLGKSYTITNVELNTGNTAVDKITMLTGALEVTQAEYSKQSYTIDGKAYEVEVVVVTTNEAKFKINGQVTDALAVGQDDEVGGIKIGVKEILENEGTETGGEDQVSFYLGSREIVLDDGGEVTVDDTEIDGSTVTITDSDAGTYMLMTAISVKTVQDGDTLFLEAGDEWADPAFGAFNVNFAGIKEDANTNIVDITGSTSSGRIEFKNSNGDDIKLKVKDTANVEFGEDGVFWFGTPAAAANEIAADLTATGNQPELIVLQDAAGTAAHHFRVKTISGFNTATTVVTIEDITAGVEEEVALGDTRAATNADVAVTTTLFGEYNLVVNWDDVAGGAAVCGDANAICLSDNTGIVLDEDINQAIDITANEGIKLNNGAYLSFDETPPIGDVGLAMAEDVTLIAAPGITLGLDDTDGIVVTEPKGTTATDGTPDVVILDDDSKDYKGYTNWGAMVEWNSESDDATITSPDDQTEIQIYVNEAGVAAVAEAGSEAASTVSISVDATIFDNELASLTGQNTIIIGGGCVNKWAADVLGVPFKEYPACAQGLPEGKAVIKLKEYGDKVALVAAGGTGDDTRRAGIVLNQYKTYALSGMEASVAGTDFTNIQVSKVQ
jgi:hypothetical protein